LRKNSLLTCIAEKKALFYVYFWFELAEGVSAIFAAPFVLAGRNASLHCDFYMHIVR